MSKLADECSETKMSKVCFLTNISGKDSKGGGIVLFSWKKRCGIPQVKVIRESTARDTDYVCVDNSLPQNEGNMSPFLNNKCIR